MATQNFAERASDSEAESKVKMTGAEMIIRAIVENGSDRIFGYPGGAVLPLYDALFQQEELRHILVRHEQAAAHAAEGYARSTGKVGVVLVTSGPGATNTITGITDAMLDSIPIVVITGQVPSHLIGSDAFQEADTTGLTRSCTKHNYLVQNIEELPRIIHEAFHVAGSGRPGPVVVDIPKDIMAQEGEYKSYIGKFEKYRPSYRPYVKPDDLQIQQINKAIALMKKAKKPLFFVGGGVINSGVEACETLTKLVRLTGFPCTTTMMGLGAYPATDKQFLCMPGMHGSLEANMAMSECDLMINIGARFDDRVTGRLDSFSPNSVKIHVDIDASSINKNVKVDVPIIADAGAALRVMLELWEKDVVAADAERVDISAWWKQIDMWRARDSFGFVQDMNDETIKPQYAVTRLYEISKNVDKEVFFTTDVGQHQMWAAQLIKFDKPNRWMTSGGLGTMGYGVPAAIGAQVAHPDGLVMCISGEASVQMNIQELATIKQYRLPVKIIVLNNRYMGMVRQWQEMFYESRYSESYMDSIPDFSVLAESYGIKGVRVEKLSELDAAIEEMIDYPGAVLLDVITSREENVYPMIPAGAAHNELLLGDDRQ